MISVEVGNPSATQDQPKPILNQRPRSVSLVRQMPGFVIIVIAIADAVRFADPDLWGHITFGRAVLEQGHLVLRDPYSYSAAGHLWFNHEWLSEVIDALVFDSLGVFGLKLVKLCATAITVIFVAMAESESNASELAQLSVLVLSAIVIAPGMQFRPQIFTFALFAILMFLLARDTYRRDGRLWVAVPVLALWANLHGGFIMGLATLGTYACVSAACDWIRGDGIRRATGLLAITAGAAAATLLTPYGIGTWIAVAHALRNPYTRIAVADWQPLFRSLATTSRQSLASALYDALPLVVMAALAIAVAISRDTDDLPMLAVSALMVAAAILAKRNSPLAIIAMACPLARHAAIAAGRLGTAALPAKAAPTPPPHLRTQFLPVLAALVILLGTGFFSNRLTAREQYPASAVSFMQSHGLHGNILDNFLWGEYLIWHMAPGSKVFMDGRYDTVYPRNVLRAFLLFHFDQSGGTDILSDYPHDFVMISPDSKAVKIMSARSDWKLVYYDSATLLYARTGSAASNLPGVPVKGTVSPSIFP